ncbi:hypothetical protein DFH06DRAFT_1306924 [Mycena polygramma]|nr:hypothetical protein DFH06DRAFT_1306924 [Mycena polygramma]
MYKCSHNRVYITTPSSRFVVLCNAVANTGCTVGLQRTLGSRSPLHYLPRCNCHGPKHRQAPSPEHHCTDLRYSQRRIIVNTPDVSDENAYLFWSPRRAGYSTRIINYGTQVKVATDYDVLGGLKLHFEGGFGECGCGNRPDARALALGVAGPRRTECAGRCVRPAMSTDGNAPLASASASAPPSRTPTASPAARPPPARATEPQSHIPMRRYSRAGFRAPPAARARQAAKPDGGDVQGVAGGAPTVCPAARPPPLALQSHPPCTVHSRAGFPAARARRARPPNLTLATFSWCHCSRCDNSSCAAQVAEGSGGSGGLRGADIAASAAGDRPLEQ